MKFGAFPNSSPSSPHEKAPDPVPPELTSTLEGLKEKTAQLDVASVQPVQEELQQDFPELDMTPEQEKDFRDAVHSVLDK